MAEILKNVESLALNPAYHDLFTVLKGARNGMVYGAKIRFPHALVMTFLFGRGTPMQKIQYVIKATRQHSFNLTKFVGLYKLLTILMRNTNSAKKELPHESFLAGCVAGYIVFGERNPVNEQVNMMMDFNVTLNVIFANPLTFPFIRSYYIASLDVSLPFYRVNQFRPIILLQK
jgi:peroxisomal membrane protein 4